MFTRHHIHSVMSTRDSMLKIEDIIKDAKENNEAFVICDHGSIASWVIVYNKCKKEGLKPIFGLEAYINKDRDELFEVLEKLNNLGTSDKDKAEKKLLQTRRDKLKKYDHIVIVAKNQKGFHNLIELANIGFVDGFYGKPTITYEELFKFKEGLIVSTACLGGTLNKYLTLNKFVDDYVKEMKDNFGDDFYLEMQFNSIPDQVKLNKNILKLSIKHDVKTIVGSDSHYFKLDWKDTHLDLLLLQNKNKRADVGKIDYKITFENNKGEVKTKKLDPEKAFKRGILAKDVVEGELYGKDLVTKVEEVNKVWAFSGDAPYLNEEDLRAYGEENHKEVKDIDKAFTGNYEIYDKIEEIVFDTDIKLPTVEDADKKLTDAVKVGLKEYKVTDKSYVARAKYELKVIKDNGFSTYFLVLKDFIDYAKDHNIPIGVGRGSAASSLVGYLLGIHRVNPMEERWNGMPFERFLSSSRYEKKIFIYDDENNKKEFTSSDIVKVLRKSKELDIKASELKEGDEFIEVVKRNII